MTKYEQALQAIEENPSIKNEELEEIVGMPDVQEVHYTSYASEFGLCAPVPTPAPEAPHTATAVDAC